MEKLLKEADQVGIVVRDLDAFLRAMEDIFGFDDFERIDYPPEEIEPETLLHGEPVEFKLKMAFRNFGGFQVEVVEPVEGPSVFQEFLDDNGPGIHHIRFTDEKLEEISEHLSGFGIKELASGKGAHGTSKWTYFDTAEALQGLYIEIRKPKF